MTTEHPDEKSIQQMLAAEIAALAQIQQDVADNVAAELAALDAAPRIIDLDTPGGSPLVSITAQSIFLTTDGRGDTGAFHRALVICRDLRRLGYWDGSAPIGVADAYAIYNSLDHRVSVAYEDDWKALVVRKAEG
jgi:hypothetical protein